jgi:hypothetical protein
MQTTQAAMLASLTNVQKFLDTHAAKLGDVAAGAARKRLDGIVAELTAHVADQSGGHFAAQGFTKKQRALRTALMRDHMAPIARIARADLPDTPEVHPLRMPRGNPGTGKLVSQARGMSQAAQPFTETFILGGLPADFVSRLDLAIDALLQAGTDRSRSQGRRGGATSGLRQRLSAGRKVVSVLDALIRSAAVGNGALLSDWAIVKRVQRAGARSGAAVPAAATTLPTSPTVTATPAPAPAPSPAAP